MKRILRRTLAVAILALPLCAAPHKIFAEPRYTEKQIEMFSSYVGKTYWVTDEKSQQPTFYTAAKTNSPTFQPAAKEGFEVKEVVEKTSDKPFYRVAFTSGKEGYIPVTAFMERINGSFTAIDPERDAKAKSAKETADEQKRRDYIRQQKWPEHVKEAAIRKEPVIGMSKKEATAVLGKPKSVVRLKSGNSGGELMGRQEQWLYDTGQTLTFNNGILVRIQ
ncbi:MAG TPA: hypothetical protein VGH50_09525 [Candidatus Binatia bacterium]